jgi:hypothetical protein
MLLLLDANATPLFLSSTSTSQNIDPCSQSFRADPMYRDDPPFDFSPPFPRTLMHAKMRRARLVDKTRKVEKAHVVFFVKVVANDVDE